ncbi:MAG: SnoaL-like domain-containing protein [Gammaproteobacteria bacterium]|jgi:limonene-1,2-epoxide hydrolase|nr:SnoaL-like domain-containing protein [Gammaproteobacteria bacterium]MBT5203695.1 SnoaL-like domain-containing protein [Gammaproteobacteria bacterium]MBT5601838.1 SnoaL-like domain-containing protein [Gammaproteobacteria bacterium]MBT6246319.1 SnoaL-like domain-containing protein [Gammaproteobacteria bacterium]
MSAEQIVTEFINNWNRMDWQAVTDALHDDVVYHNIPMEKIQGKEAAAAFITGMQPKAVDWIMVNIASNGNLVLTERIDNFTLANGKLLSLPVMGTFEIEDSKIKAWRDYFDLATFTSQMG